MSEKNNKNNNSNTNNNLSHYYELLGIKLFESDTRIIEVKARERIQYLNKMLASADKEKKASIRKVLSEVSRACIILKDAKEKQYYDIELSLRLGIEDENISIEDIKVHKDTSFDRKAREKIENNICPVCDTQNPSDAKICDNCHALLTRTCPECGTEVSIYLFLCTNCETNIDDFLLVETTYKLIEEYSKKREWDKMIRLHDVLHENLHLPGKKGSEYLRKIGNLNAEGKEKRKKMLLLKPKIEATLKSKNNLEALKLLKQYTHIAPLNDPLHNSYRRILRKTHGKSLLLKLFATFVVIALIGGAGFFFYHRSVVRKQRFEKLCKEAQQLMYKQKWASALKRFEDARRIPGYEDDSAVLNSINSIKNTIEQFNDTVNRADKQFRKQKFEKAIELYKQALNIAGFEKDKDVLKKLKKAKDELALLKRKRNFDRLLKYAKQYMNNKKWDEAIKTLKEASEIPDLGNQDIVNIMLMKAKKIKKQYADAVEQIDKYIKEKKYDVALDTAFNALSLPGYEKDEAIRQKIEFIKNQQKIKLQNAMYDKQIVRAEKFLKAHVWKKAVKEFRKALNMPAKKKDKKFIEEKIKFAEKFITQYRNNMRAARELMKRKLWMQAQDILQKTSDIPGYKDDFDIIDMLKVIKKKIGTQMLLEAKEGKKKVINRGPKHVLKRVKQYGKLYMQVRKLYAGNKKKSALKLANKLINAIDSYLYDNEDSLPTEAFEKLNDIRNRLEKLRAPYCPVKIGRPWIIKDYHIEMVPIKKGTFQMGSPTSEMGRYYTEIRHTVTITRPFWISKYEITRDQFKKVMGYDPSQGEAEKDTANYPVDSVSWKEAAEFCRKLTRKANLKGELPYGYVYRLPTEAEWEYVCRAGTDTPFFSGYGLSLRRYAYFKDNANNRVRPVGRKKPNPWGLFDMHGNLKEWCYDWYDVYRATSTVDDPAGPTMGTKKILRGGGWTSPKEKCRSAFREFAEPELKMPDIGFRIVMAPKIKK